MAERKNYHIIHLPRSPCIENQSIDASTVAEQWIKLLNQHLTNPDNAPLDTLFHDDSWWRDMLALTWDFRTIRGLTKITGFLSEHQPRVEITNLRLDPTAVVPPNLETPVAGLSWVTALFTFQTRIGRGSGVVYITQSAGDGQWKAYSVYTALQELKGHEEHLGTRRPEGTIPCMPSGVPGENWLEGRRRQVEFIDGDPTVLIIGAGQSGLNLAARLQALGQRCLIVEKNDRVGDNWRKRYRTLVTHDHIESCHMAYLPFPKTWPKYLPKDKLADWLESYATIMELNVYTKTNIVSAQYSDAKGEWTVTLSRDGVQRTLHPRHIAWCGGLYGAPKKTTFPGLEGFGGVVYHASEHQDASLYACQGKKVVVVGTGNSGHDIAEDYCRHGAEVTMIQRGPTYVLTEKNGLPLLPENMGIDDDRTPIDVKDILSESLPWSVTLALGVDLTKRISEADKETLHGLEKAGFNLGFGVDGAGILRLIVTRAGGYYIDVGCSQLIIDGKIKMKYSPVGITGFDQRGVLLEGEDRLDADIVVLATGYENMLESVGRVLGEKVAARCKPVWDLDHEGELRTIWRPSGHPGFWFMGGSLSLCRIYSRFVALQIVAAELGLA
ncbi:putative flavin-binding monooxygenase [Aspergillus crustosus]